MQNAMVLIRAFHIHIAFRDIDKPSSETTLTKLILLPSEKVSYLKRKNLLPCQKWLKIPRCINYQVSLNRLLNLI